MFPLSSFKAKAKNEDWLWPVAEIRGVGSNYGLRDLDGNGTLENYHRGIDINGFCAPGGNASGYPVRASKSGYVYYTESWYADNTYIAGSLGNCVFIDHKDGTYSLYAHMKPDGIIEQGTYVKQGDVIGYIGNTGDSTGPHLHFQIYTDINDYNGSTLNPMPTNESILIKNVYSLPHGWASQYTTYIFETTDNPSSPSSNYLDNPDCKYYPCGAIIEVKTACNPYSLPCNSETAAKYDTKSEALTSKALSVGDRFVATALYKNTEGNYWYETKFPDGTTGYVFANRTEFYDFEIPWVDGGWFYANITGATPLYGVVRTTGTLDAVQAIIYKGTGAHGTTATSSNKVQVNGHSYSLNGSTVDNTLHFEYLTTGHYTLAIAVEYSTYYSEGGQLEKTGICSNAAIYNFSFGNVSPLNKYTINYNANDGTGAPSAQTKIENESLQLSSQIPYREGYTFLGWSESKNASSAALQPGDWFDSNYSTTLYAVWTPKVYTIEFDSNGGNETPFYQGKLHGTNTLLLRYYPTRSGYEFLGWSTDKNSSAIEYNSGSYFLLDQNITLYAVWKKTSTNDPYYPPVTTEGILGDVNNDGKIDQYDYVLVKRHHFDTRTLTEDEATRADANKDGKVDTYDYLLIARHYFVTYVIEG